MSEPRVVVVMREFKQDLLRRESIQVAQMVMRWRSIEVRLEGQIAALAQEATAMGATRGQIMRLRRYQALLAQTREQIAGYEGYAMHAITQGQSEWGQLGIQQATTAIEETFRDAGIYASFNRLPVSAVERMVGLAGDGSPLFDVLQKRALYPDAVQGLTDALVQGVARGWNPRKVASRMADGLAEGLNKALVIARTETLRAYRSASTAQYRTSGVVQNMVRLAAKDETTCLACLCQDGEVIPIDEEMYDHVCGRCVAVPQCEGVDLPEWEKGADWFEGLSVDTQEEMMGGERYAAWKDGQFDFRDLAIVTDDPTWGKGLQVRPLGELA